MKFYFFNKEVLTTSHKLHYRNIAIKLEKANNYNIEIFQLN